MLQRHVMERLAALADGQLDAAEAAKVHTHLAACASCRDAREQHAFAASLMNELAVVKAPAAIWTAIERELDRVPVSDRAPRDTRRIGGWWTLAPAGWRPAVALAGMLALAAIVAVVWQARPAPAPWDVVRMDPSAPGRLAQGEWIETTATSRAMVRIGEIGTVEIAPNTRVQLIAARADEQRLNLARGTISAQILAPPRLFFVETPASTVVDLGCAYTMTVDEAGDGELRVTSGWASLEWSGRESLVPAGASCPTRPSVGPGTPSFDDATPRLREALLRFDFAGGGEDAIGAVLSEARPRDTLTLWHLLSRVDAGERVRIFDRMVALTPLPPGVARDKALALDPETLKLWREELAWTW